MGCMPPSRRFWRLNLIVLATHVKLTRIAKARTQLVEDWEKPTHRLNISFIYLQKHADTYKT